MKQTRLVFAAAVAVTCTWASFAVACDNAKTTAAATSKKKTTAVVASNDKSAACSAEMAAACKGKGVSATAASMTAQSAPSCCAGKSASSVKTAAMTASATTAPAGTVNAVAIGSDDHCASGAKTTAAAAGTKTTAVVAGAGGSCSAHGTKTTAMAAGAGGSCSGNGVAMKSGAKMTGHNCDACSDMAMCEDELKTMGASMQAVAIKNGVMFVYSADATKVSGVQSAIARRGDRMTTILASGDKATLCPECKSMRGAVASGKLTREQVNIEGGCMTLMTSNDPAMVAKIQAMAGVKGSSRTKS